MKTTAVSEFLPLPARSGWTRVLGVILTIAVLVPGLLGVHLVTSRPSITCRIEGGMLVLRGGESVFASHRTIPLDSVLDIDEVRLDRGRRTAGTGLPGLCAGYFSYDNLGPVWQVTDCRREVLLLRIRDEKRPVLLTPADREAFRAALASRQDGDFSPPPHPQPWWWLAFKIALIAFTLPVAAYVGAAFLLAARRLRYEVTGGELVVHLLVLRKRFPLSGTRARRYTPSRALRWGGTGMPGYFAGRFSLDRRSTRVYASALKREGVLLEGEPNVFVTPADIDGFVAAIRANGARVE